MEGGNREGDGGGNGGRALASQKFGRCAILADAIGLRHHIRWPDGVSSFGRTWRLLSYDKQKEEKTRQSRWGIAVESLSLLELWLVPQNTMTQCSIITVLFFTGLDLELRRRFNDLRFHYLNPSLVLKSGNIISISYHKIIQNFGSISLVIFCLSKYNVYYQWPTRLNINSNNIYQLKQSPTQSIVMFRLDIAYLVWKKAYFIPSSHLYQYLY